MIKEHKKTLILTCLITLIPMFIGLYFWDSLPDRMATHFGINSQADGYSGKAFAVFGLPILLVGLQIVMLVSTSLDPKKKNISPKMIGLILWIIPVVSLICAAVMYPYNLGYRMNITFYMMLFLGAVFTIVGNFLPKTRQNYTVGFKLPWTLENEDNWNRTHRLAGFLWVAAGLLTIVITLLGFTNVWVSLGMIIAASIVPVIYSYAIRNKTEQPD